MVCPTDKGNPRGLGCLMEGVSSDPASELPHDLEQVAKPFRPVSQL